MMLFKRQRGASSRAQAAAMSREPEQPAAQVLALPELQRSEDWPAKPGVRLRFGPVDEPLSEPENATEEVYAAGLEALSNDDAPAALQRFRSVMAENRVGTYSTARLLALTLSAEVGDVATVRALLGSCITNAQPDAFAQRAIQESRLDLYQAPDSDRPDIVVWECIDQPAVTTQISLAACLLAAGQTAEAAKALEDGVTVWEARNAAWALRAEAIAEETSDAGARPWIAHELIHKSPPDFGLADHRVKAITAARLRDGAAPRGPAGALVGFDATLCRLYIELGDLDAVLQYIARYPPWGGSEITRARVLDAKGMPDSALVVLDDYLRRPPDDDFWATAARYTKAEILTQQGNRRGARRELARIYADHPDWEDWRDLRAQLDAPTDRPSRAPIPEDIRHAVWRRDEDRCVECGSQENLEFDHIIPLSRGGANTERNLQLLCERCNRTKGATI
jgi:tetratricopeptide (TPR) repeat protein